MPDNQPTIRNLELDRYELGKDARQYAQSLVLFLDCALDRKDGKNEHSVDQI
jgi:hypothetical protein